MTAEERSVQRDRMRFTKNSLSSNLAIIGILFNVFYFVSLYKSDVGTYYYTILVGGSIVYNLIFMLAVFLASEGVKNYKQSYSYLLLVVGALQIARIFIIPSQAHAAMTLVNGAEIPVMEDAQFIRIVVYLAVSAVCLILSALVNLYKCRELSTHMKSLETQTA